MYSVHSRTRCKTDVSQFRLLLGPVPTGSPTAAQSKQRYRRLFTPFYIHLIVPNPRPAPLSRRRVLCSRRFITAASTARVSGCLNFGHSFVLSFHQPYPVLSFAAFRCLPPLYSPALECRKDVQSLLGVRLYTPQLSYNSLSRIRSLCFDHRLDLSSPSQCYSLKGHLPISRLLRPDY